ncbi:Response regulator PleD [Paenibacillus konkukensis]|uniref:Response regulator PleD n=1 Tax=Paenibacillus konkukensis TaxID=2020716 RepID=A0ABY4RHQ6_9BACL|nr:sensor domain-containing diguanylate cyclase [Paenibacillus konkukensis]UQZ80962.1 Response regulator PleD [Paenibacillus konkukensis]
MSKLHNDLPTGKKQISLATLLTGLVSVSVLLTLTILLIASYQSNKQSLFTTTLALNYSTAEKMSQTMDSLFKSMRSSLQYTAAYLSENCHMSETEVQKQLDLLRHNSSYFNSIMVVDQDGMFRSIAPASIAAAGQPIASPVTREALDSQKSYISKPFTSPTGRLIVLMSEPLYDENGDYRGFVGGTLYLGDNNVLNMIFGKNDIDESGSYFYVVDTTGQLLFHPIPGRLGEDVGANSVVQKVLRGQSGHELVVNTLGVPLLAGYSPVTEVGWGVIVNSPISVVYEQLHRLIRSIVLYTLAPFVLLLAAAIWLARKLAGPFVSLADLVNRLGRGVRTPIPDLTGHWNREADLLARAVASTFQDLQKQTDQLTHAAMTDALTGLTNRRTLEAILQQWTSEQCPFCLVLLDIDRFKTINDSYGHQTGDEVLKHVARMVGQSVRNVDICCRFGGEEFVVLLPHSSLTDAGICAERIRTTIEQSKAPIDRPVTVSLGISCFPSHAPLPRHAPAAQGLLRC